MTKSAMTVFFFGLYLFLLAITLIVAPNTLLGLFRMPPTSEVWIRVVGMLTACIGVYYVVAARANVLPLLEASVRVRLGVAACLGAFVALGWAPWTLALFGGADVAGALWTWLTIRSEVGPRAQEA